MKAKVLHICCDILYQNQTLWCSQLNLLDYVQNHSGFPGKCTRLNVNIHDNFDNEYRYYKKNKCCVNFADRFCLQWNYFWLCCTDGAGSAFLGLCSRANIGQSSLSLSCILDQLQCRFQALKARTCLRSSLNFACKVFFLKYLYSLIFICSFVCQINMSASIFCTMGDKLNI